MVLPVPGLVRDAKRVELEITFAPVTESESEALIDMDC